MRTTAATRAFMVPDAAFWAAAGIDLASFGVRPAWSPRTADALVVCERVSPGLHEALREARARLPAPGAVRIVAGVDLQGKPAEAVLRAAGEQQEREDGYAEESHGDMMAVTGEPSRDGLVMEDVETIVGPIAPSLPTGLSLHLTLDGDVVCDARVEPTLAGPLSDGTPDGLARAAFVWVAARAGAEPGVRPAHVPRRLAATEVERALSHTMWLARFAELIGWLDLADSLRDTARPLVAAHDVLAPREAGLADLAGLRPLERSLAGVLSGRRLARRTRGVAVVSGSECAQRGIAGPIARAAGSGQDLRSNDAAYQALGFRPVTREAGDAQARAEVRIEESLASIGLARAALAEADLPSGGGRVEGPRGPLAVAQAGPSGATVFLAPGAAAAREVAAASARGEELARALVAVASFDLSPWAVGG